MNCSTKTVPLVLLLLSAAGGCAAGGAGSASEFRVIDPIRRPGAERAAAAFPLRGAPVPQAEVERAVRELVASWNTPRFRDFLGDELYDASRLADSMDAEVPRDARLTVLSVEGAQTLGHRRVTGPGGEPLLVSRVQVTVRTQVELDHPELGYRRIDGVNELVLDVTRKIRTGEER